MMLLRNLGDTLALKFTRHVVVLSILVLTLMLVVWTLHGYPSGTPSLLSTLPNPIHSSFANTRGSLEHILNSTLGFERILAINLPERTDHRDGLVLAAAVSNISIQFVEGTHGDSVSAKALPSYHKDGLHPGIIGSWRAHMTAVSKVVEEGWATALILEDDVDWDIRLKGLLQDFAVSSSFLLQHGTASQGEVRMEDMRPFKQPKSSPYGDNWDVLWLGHCGMDVPKDTSLVRHEDDPTVPEVKHLKSWDETAISPLKDYPPHTRLVMPQKQGVCSLAYAVSQAGARKLLYAVGLQRLEGPFDIMLREFCEGTNNGNAKRNNNDGSNRSNRCMGVLPQLFDHHRRVGHTNSDSDISPDSGQFRDKAYTYNIRQSVRINMPRLLEGIVDYIDQWPDS